MTLLECALKNLPLPMLVDVTSAHLCSGAVDTCKPSERGPSINST